MPPIRRSNRLTSNRKRKSVTEETQDKKEKEKLNSSEEEKESILCAGCCRDEPPKTISTVKEITWLECDLCNKWWHSVCAGYTTEDAGKIISTGIKFPCALCIIKQPYILLTAEYHQTTSDTKTDQKIDKLLEITKTIGQGYLQSNNHKQNTEGKLPRALREKKDPEKIIIIDNIEQPNTAIDSTTIRKELTKIKALEDQIEEAYSLPKGGIAIHLKDQKTRDKIIKSWPINTSVFGEKSVAHKPRSINHGTNSCYLHNIPVHLSEENLSLDLSHLYKIKEVKRKKYRDTGKLMPVVKVTFTDHGKLKKLSPQKDTATPAQQHTLNFKQNNLLKLLGATIATNLDTLASAV
ncbi:unnamed protein product [Mytilus edulis]|uniref:PHD-type domain-containing protein n=1 Tax=Mytilus edulis TaxID=6550 RepID=A0A8S3TAE4_MYTED|nr:unnamed protein product [Mytilus edulis]